MNFALISLGRKTVFFGTQETHQKAFSMILVQWIKLHAYQELVDVTTLKMARKPVKIQRKVQQDALGKVNRMKEISRREQDGLKITDNKHYVRKTVERACIRYLTRDVQFEDQSFAD